MSFGPASASGQPLAISEMNVLIVDVLVSMAHPFEQQSQSSRTVHATFESSHRFRIESRVLQNWCLVECHYLSPMMSRNRALMEEEYYIMSSARLR